jgi:hypothetical protein
MRQEDSVQILGDKGAWGHALGALALPPAFRIC